MVSGPAPISAYVVWQGGNQKLINLRKGFQMADFTSQFTFADTARSGFRRMLASVARGVETMAEARSRRAQIERLEAMSNDELAELGLKREDIAQHVFRDTFYI